MSCHVACAAGQVYPSEDDGELDSWWDLGADGLKVLQPGGFDFTSDPPSF